MVEVEISIICLIYKSAPLAQALYESVRKYTPKLASGQAEFFFVANDPSENVMKFLKSHNIPYYVNVNEHLSDERLFGMGFGTPEYMRRVYQGYNFGILKAKGQKVVLVNSDNFFSQDWLENLLKYSDYKKVVCSTLVEPGQDQAGVFPFAVEMDFGRTLDNFREDEFQAFAEKLSKTGYTSGGAYMPCLLYKDIAVLAGLYPEGNLAGKTFGEISRYGDEYFYDKLREFGVEHITAKDSIVYHLKEGEKSEATRDLIPYKASLTEHPLLNERLVVHPRDLIPYINPEVKHKDILDGLARKATALILMPVDAEEVEGYLKTIKGLDFKNFEIVLITNDKKLAKKYEKQLRTITVSDKADRALYDLFHDMYGEHLLLMNRNCKYSKELFRDVNERNVLYYFGSEETVNNLTTDYMGYYLFPKQALVSRTSTFLGFLTEKDKIEVDFSDFTVVTISNMPTLSKAEKEQSALYNLAKRVVRKIQRDGVRGLARAVTGRLIK